MMNYLYLRAFHAVASERSFTRAAQVLHVSQSTLSWQVKALEESYGVRLLDRRGKNVVPTDVGGTTLALTREVFRIQDEIATVLDRSQRLQAGRLKVGADGPRHIMPVLDDFMRLHPDVVVSLTTGNAKKVLSDLLNYETDVAIVASPKARETQLHMTPFCTYPLVAFVSRKHPWSNRKTIGLKDFDGERLIVREPTSMTRQLLFRALRKAKAQPSALIEIDSREASREAVALGMGVGVMSSMELPSLDPRYMAVPIRDPSLRITEYVACLAKRRGLRTIKEFFRSAGNRSDPAFKEAAGQL
jgi:LysR family transcriptional regulator, low CO2-responsive transcriptional regulator